MLVEGKRRGDGQQVDAQGTSCPPTLCMSLVEFICTWKMTFGSLVISFDSARLLVFGGAAFKTETRKTATANKTTITIGLFKKSSGQDLTMKA